MMRLRLCFLFFLVIVLSACSTRPIVVIEKKPFLQMAHEMNKEMRARNLLDSDGSYVAPFSFAGLENYGKILFERLSPSFMQEADNTAHDIYFGATFAATMLPDSRVKHWPNGFSIQHATQKITLNMVAIADWNNDGEDEWIVSCLVEPRRGGRTRNYYLLVPPPRSNTEKLRGTVAAINECFGLACTLFVRDSKIIERVAADPLAKPTEVHDVAPGLQPVTEPPTTRQKTSDLEERAL